MRILPFPLPAVIAHRGASATAPENTLAAFRRAADEGARWIECDVKLTADGRPIVIHDDSLERTTDGGGAVADTTLDVIGALDAGGLGSRRSSGANQCRRWRKCSTCWRS